MIVLDGITFDRLSSPLTRSGIVNNEGNRVTFRCGDSQSVTVFVSDGSPVFAACTKMPACFC